jgi:hypothetical protein
MFGLRFDYKFGVGSVGNLWAVHALVVLLVRRLAAVFPRRSRVEVGFAAEEAGRQAGDVEGRH